MPSEKSVTFPEGSLFHQDTLKHLKFICILIACGLDLASVGAMIVLVTDIESSFNISHTQSGWALTSYVITFAGFIAFFGRVGDIIGNGIMMSVFSILFGILSLLCAVVPNFIAFTVFRAFQGMAGAGIVPCAYALVNMMFQGPNLQRYFSILSTILSGMAGVGFIIGGAFGETAIGYESFFYFLFAASLATAAVICVLIGYPEFLLNRHSYKEKFQRVYKLDVIGCLLFISGSILLVVGLTQGGESWNDPTAYVPLAISIVLLIVFFMWNLGYTVVLRLIKPISTQKGYAYMESVNLLIPKDLMLSHNFIPVLLATFFLFSGFMVAMYVIANYSATVEGNSMIVASIKIIPLICGLVLANGTVAYKQDLFRPKNALVVGSFISILGGAFFVPIKYVDSNLFWKLFLMGGFLTGLGGAIFFCHMLTMAIGDAPDQYKALAGGIVQTAGQFGNEVSLSIVISLLGNQTTDKIDLRNRFQNASYIIIAAATVSTLVSLFLVKGSLESSGDEEKQLSECSESTISSNSNAENPIETILVTCPDTRDKKEETVDQYRA
ncbi:hypothetical protein KDRO_C00330 [Kluyveromyces lactis]|nr:hypothetical protein KDRO_C00330 [Kluyveromyces lactis]